MISPPHLPPVFVNMMLNVNRNPKAYSRNGEEGRGAVMSWGKRESIYTYRYTFYHQNDSSIIWAAMRAILMFQ